MFNKVKQRKRIEIINSYEKEEKRIKIINQGLEKEEKESKEKIKEIKEILKEKEKEINSAEEKIKETLALREKLREITETEKEINSAEEKIKELKEKENERKKEFSEEKLRETEEKIKETEKRIELIEEFFKCKEWKKEFNAFEKEMKEINYIEGSLGEKKESLVSLKEMIESAEKEIKMNYELIESIKSNIEKVEKEKERIKKMQEEITQGEFSLGKLALFNNALNETQAELRKEMIDTINQAMDDVWERIYPYGDFTSAKMEIEEGNYEIKVREKNGKWVRVEGILSGGERSAAAICIRVAFSLVLTQNLSWLILDEPTHNLDRNAVIKLSSMMKEHLPNLVDQIFVITHDSEMEKAASAVYCEITRDKENEGSSVPKSNNLN